MPLGKKRKLDRLQEKGVKETSSRPRGKSILQRQNNEIISQDALCHQCKTIDFEKIFQIKPKNGQSFAIQQLGASSTTTSCPACRFFATMIESCGYMQGWERELDVYRDGYHRFQLRAYSAFRLIGTRSRPKEVSDSVFLAVVPDNCSSKELDSVAFRQNLRYLLCTPSRNISAEKRFVGRQVPPIVAELDTVREWMRICKDRHGNGCNPPSNRHSIKGFKVIDCNSRKIIDAPVKCTYAALSYVWGQSHQPIFMRILPIACPAAIEDAMTAAKQLGFRYLWVDRYCIDQSDETEKHIQIANMDLVYANASITIISSDSKYTASGLPGISVPRTTQPFLEVGDIKVVSVLENPRNVINGSEWSSRGWTYQEGLLSKRRLVFTDQQMYFQCLGMHCFESISMPLQYLHGSKQLREDIDTYRLHPGGGVGKKPEDFVKRINEYAKRSLSYESDVLDAISGIFKVYERSTPPIHQLQGIPLFPMLGVDMNHTFLSVKHNAPKRLISWTRSLATGLAWAAVSDDSPMHLQHRDGFPSWSWAGWSGWDSGSGAISFPHLSFHGELSRLGPSEYVEITFGDRMVEILFLDKHGAQIIWDRLSAASKPSNPFTEIVSSVYFLRISCYALDVKLHRDEPEDTPSIQIADAKPEIYRKDPVLHLCTTDFDFAEPLHALVLTLRQEGPTEHIGWFQTTHVTCLIVTRKEEYWTRVGTVTFSLYDHIANQMHNTPSSIKVSNGGDAIVHYHRRTFTIG